MGVIALFAATVFAQTPPPPFEAPAIVSVEVHLPAGADPRLMERVPSLVTIRRGQTVSRRALSRTIENLYATGRFSNVTIDAEDVVGGVAVSIELVPKREISELYVEGGSSVPSAEVLAAARLERTNEFWPERIAQAGVAVADLYRRRGFRQVKVETRVDSVEGGVAVGFLVAQGSATRISSIAMVGDPQLPLPRLLTSLAVQPGEVLDLQRLEAGVELLRKLFRVERYYRARVELPQVEEGGRVIIPVTAGPRYDVLFSGNRAVSSTSLKAVLAYDGEELLDSTLEARLANRLSRFYRFRGYHDVRVTPTEVLQGASGGAVLGFAIDEGSPVRVVEVAFRGNQAVADADLREVLRRVMEASAPVSTLEVHAESDPLGLEGRMAPVFAGELPAPPPETVLDEDAWAEAAKAMAALYRGQGYLGVHVRFEPVDVRGTEARAAFTIVEGAQASFRRVTSTGLPAGFKSDALDELRTGSPFSTDALEVLRQRVQRELGRKGWLFASLEAAYTLDTSGRFADCVVSATPGPQVKVRAVLPVGNERTVDEVLLSQATMLEGLPLDADALFRTQNNLIGLGIFRTVEVEMLSPERPEPLKTVLLKVRERPRVSGEIGLGYFLADGPRIVVDLGAPNLGGRAINLNAHGQLNFFALSQPALSKQVDVSDLQAWEQLGGRANLSVQSRSLLPANLGVRFDVVGERVFRPQFRFSRIAGVPSIDWSTSFEVPRIDWLRPKFSVALQYELEWSRVQSTSSAVTAELPITLPDQERLRFALGTFALQTVRLNPTLDLRDNSLTPHRGLLLQATAEVTGAIFAEDAQNKPVVVNFLKASALATGYVPVWRSLVLAVSARGGRILPLSAGSTTPPVHRFFLGGATSMRGFNEDQLIAADLRDGYRKEVRECQILAVKDGCTSAARAVAAGRQIPSQGGELFALFKGELRFPAFSVFDLGVFVEAGNLWLEAPSQFIVRWVAGAGVRYTTPVGPLALDVAVNLNPDQVLNEPQFVVHFNIGVF
jgi:outer membrane protein insertion porin family